MAHSIREIATALGAEAEGDLDLQVVGVAEPQSAGPDELALAIAPKYGAAIAEGRAKAAMLWPGADWRGMGLKAVIFAPRGRFAMSGLTRMMDRGPQIAPGVDPQSVIDPSAVIGAGAAIGPFVAIAAGVVIGPGARIASHVSVAEGARIGAEALIFAGVRIGAGVTIGDRFICHPNVVIGGDGFSFVTPEKSGVEEVRETLRRGDEIRPQSWVRIHSLGAVTIGDDVEIGANSCVDRGTIRDTVVESGTKLDNLVQIGHNVQIGRDCLICGQVGVGGSTRVGDRVVLGGKCGVGDNLSVGDDVIAGAGTIILSNVPAGRVLLGYPAVKIETHIEMQKAVRRLPRLAAKIAGIEAALAALSGVAASGTESLQKSGNRLQDGD